MHRQEADAHVGHHRLLDRLVARHLDHHRRMDAPLLEEDLHRGARARAGLAHEEHLVAQQRRGAPATARASGCSGAATIASGFVRERLGARIELARRRAHDREIDLVVLQLRDQRLPVADFEAQLDGRDARAGTRRGACGTKYFAVLTMPMVSRPLSTPFMRAIVSAASLSAASIRRACTRKYSPGVVSAILRPLRSNSGSPTAPSSSLTCIEIAGWRQVQLLRCAGEAQVARGAGEDLQLADGHASHKLLLISDVNNYLTLPD